MEVFAIFFIGIIVIFSIMQRVYRNKDILQIKSNFDNRTYIVRKLPDGRRAANTLAKINKNVLKLIDSLDDSERIGISPKLSKSI